nr:hypothetical protein [uncultured Desulfovibrio sp.]
MLVKSPIMLVMFYDSAGIGQHGLSLFLGIPCKGFFMLCKRRKILHLLRIKNARHAQDGPFKSNGFPLRLAVLAENRFAVFSNAILFFRELVVDHSRGAAARLDTVACIIGLFQRHPARILMAGHGQVQPVHALVDCAGKRIARRKVFRRMPRLLPGSRALFQHFDNLAGKFLMEWNPLFLIPGHLPLLPPQEECLPEYPSASERLP